MTDWLVVRLPHSPEDPVQWVLTDDRGQLQAAPGSGALAEAATHRAGRRVLALLCGADVHASLVPLPVRSGPKALQVAPFAMEEQLAEDVESLHFALGRAAPGDDRVPVAAIDRALLERWLVALRAAGLEPERVLADTALLPQNPAQAVALLDADTLYIRPAGSGAEVFTLPAEDLRAAFEVALGTAALPEAHVLLYATASDWARLAAQSAALQGQLGSLQVQALSAGALPWLALQIAESSPINLLQGSFAPQNSMAQHWQRWRLVAALLGALILVHAAGQTLVLRQLRAEAQTLGTAITEATRAVLPQESGVGAVRQRLEKRLVAAHQSHGGSDLIGALGAYAGAVRGEKGATLESLGYQNAVLQIKVHTPDAESLERINQALRRAGWQAELSASSAAGGSFEGRIELRPGARS